jgi:hypothetical protein
MRRVIFNLINSFIVLINILFFIELIFFLKSSDKIDNFANTQEFQRKYVVRNSHGYRDNEYSYKKPENIFRILVLGDSQTFGHGIKKLEDTWHKKLEVLMNQGLKDKRFEIISLAGEGWNTDTQLYELFKNGFKYNPDLILLAFYQNDVPSPYGFKCQSEDIPLFPKSKTVTWIRNYSKFYQFTEYRINRLLERLGRKTTFPDCINNRFNSRGWDIEEIYLDTILMSSQIKNIHFMITTIPLVYKLDEDYPIKSSHAKVENYCTKKRIECLDLYDGGFKGLDYTELVYSKTDQHLNEKGTEVVAKNLYKKLQPLKTYRNLSKFHGAFDLNELLNKKPIVKDLDKQFEKVEKKNQIIKIKSENEELEVINHGKYFQYTNIISKKTKPTIYKIKLGKKGNFIENEINYYTKNNPNIFYEINKTLKTKNILISGAKSRTNKLEISKKYKRQTKKIFLGKYKELHSGIELVLFENLLFPDPKVLEKKIFKNTIEYAITKSEKEKLNLYKKFLKKNHKFLLGKFDFSTPNNKIKKTKLNKNINILALAEELIIYNVLGFNKYVLKLGSLISRKKPSETAIKSLLIYYWITKKFELYNNLVKENPSLKRFVLD